MQTAARRLVANSALILAVLAIAACRDDVTAVDTEDALAQDSALALSVLQAHENAVAIEAVVEEAAPAPAQIAPRRAPAVARVTPPPAIEPRRPAPELIASALPARAAPKTATVPAGTELALDAGRRICVNTSKVGDRFTARLARSSGTIPSRARATASITRLVGPMGEETIDVAVRSIAVGGRTYPVASRVTRIELDRKAGADRCIPDDGRITARLTRPLLIAL